MLTASIIVIVTSSKVFDNLLRTKSIYDDMEEHDGIRVLVTRFWPRGIRKERVSTMISALAPSKKLLL
jgi:uncharacterized protein YeaO (DUF488 family)